MGHFKITKSCHGMQAIEIVDATADEHRFLKGVLRANRIDDPSYSIRTNAGAFLQGGAERNDGWILIEFWQDRGVQAFIEYVNALWIDRFGADSTVADREA